MLFYFSKKISTTAREYRVKEVCCEHCGTAYFYEMTRLGVGRDSAPYGLGYDAAQQRSERAAEQNLEARLRDEVELVPCPRCNWVNDALVLRWRESLYRRVWIVIACTLVLGLLLWMPLLIVLGNHFGDESRACGVLAVAWLLLVALSPVAILWLRRVLRRRRADPNSTFPRRPRLPPGTPPALSRHVDHKTREVAFVPVPQGGTSAGARGTWAVYREGRVRFPDTCCVCAKATGRRLWSPPLGAGDADDSDALLCDDCEAALRRRWWASVPLVVLLAAAVSTVTMSLLEAAWPGLDSANRIVLGVLLLIFVSGIGIAFVPTMRCRPYRLEEVDEDRGVARFRARNPAYTRLLINRINADDGRGAA